MTCAEGGPATFSVVSGAGITAGTGGEDGGFAGFEGRGRDEEDKFEARGGGGGGGHGAAVSSYANPIRVMVQGGDEPME